MGSATALLIPALGRSRLGQSRLRGLGLLHTHLAGEEISQEDLMDLLFLRLDYLSVLQAGRNGEPAFFQYSYLMPSLESEEPYYISRALPPDRADLDLPAQIEALEQEMSSRQPAFAAAQAPRSAHRSAHRPGRRPAYSMSRSRQGRKLPEPENHAGQAVAAEHGPALSPPSRFALPAAASGRAILVSVSKAPRRVQERFLAELADLAVSAGVEVCAQVMHRPPAWHGSPARMLLGEVSLAELEVLALKAQADMLIFDGELTPAQIDYLARITERKVLDRTMLILDIFAQRAASSAGRLQVELAQLEYALPRLAGRNAGRAMDRLAGGIGGRGPGETRLELDRRRIRDRIAGIRLELKRLDRQRELARRKRTRAELPSICLVGYTNTGKSTLLNRLTQSSVYVENQLFATLDSTSRRLFVPAPADFSLPRAPGLDAAPTLPVFPAQAAPLGAYPLLETIISDTIGFIRDLPDPLRVAFAAVLEDLENADLLLHVADASHPDFELQVEAVQKILAETGFASTPCLLVLNKWDLLSSPDLAAGDSAGQEEAADRMLAILERYPQSVPVSAAQGLGLDFLKQKIGQLLCAHS